MDTEDTVTQADTNAGDGAQAGAAQAEALLKESATLRVCMSVMTDAWRLFHVARQTLDRYVESHGEIEHSELVKEFIVQAASHAALKPFEAETLERTLREQCVKFVAAYDKQQQTDKTKNQHREHAAKLQTREQRKAANIPCGFPLESRTQSFISKRQPITVVGTNAARAVALDAMHWAVSLAGVRPESPDWRVLRLSGNDSMPATVPPNTVWRTRKQWMGQCETTGSVRKLVDAANKELDGPIDLLIMDDAVWASRKKEQAMLAPAVRAYEAQFALRRLARELGIAVVIGVTGAETLWAVNKDTPQHAVGQLHTYTLVRYVEGPEHRVALQQDWYIFGQSQETKERKLIV